MPPPAEEQEYHTSFFFTVGMPSSIRHYSGMVLSKSEAPSPELAQASSAPAGTLGTFLGVFTPTVLTILGVIMYLRFGWMVGQVGLAAALGIVVLGNVITLLTTLSFSAIATNGPVGGGGAYFMISRGLGLELGGAIGLPLFLSQVFSITLYAYGLAEALGTVIEGLPISITAFVIIILVALLASKGTDLALKAQLPVMILVGISIVALALGVLGADGQLLPADDALPATQTVPFWQVFAVFFPAVTGVTAGLGLSGDLKDPSKSIPKGALAAVLTGFVLYLGIVVLLGIGATPEALRTHELVWLPLALGGAVVVMPGLWGAIFSSAVGSMLGAPRTLQALAQDHAQRHPLLAELAKKPMWGQAITACLALGAVFLGALNDVAVVVSMFFLTVYGSVNMVAALEAFSGSATWRPRLRVHGGLCLLGALGCVAVMILISPGASLAAIGVELILWLLFQRLEWSAEWGDARRDVYESIARWSLLRLAQRPMTARNWRPHLLLFVHKLERHHPLVRLGNAFCRRRGLLTVCELWEGDILTLAEEAHARRAQIQNQLAQMRVVAFGELHVVQKFTRGIIDVVQANGLAGLESNTVMLGWPAQPERLVKFLQILQRLDRLQKSALICHTPHAATQADSESLSVAAMPSALRRSIDPFRVYTIHVWWGGLQRNGDLMLLLAHLLTLDPRWRPAKITVLSIASNEMAMVDSEKRLQELIPQARINAQARVILKPKDSTVREIIHRESGNADAVLLGLAIPKEGDEPQQAERMREMVAGLNTTFFVHNASPFGGELLGEG